MPMPFRSISHVLAAWLNPPAILALSTALLLTACGGGGGAAVSSGGGGGGASAGSFTLLHTSPSSIGCSGSTTCSVPLTASLGANNLVTVECFTADPVALSSVNAGGTLVPVYSASGIGSTTTGWLADGYIYPTVATAGPIVITPTAGSFGAGSGCVIREYSVSSGTPILDWAHGSTAQTVSHPYNGESPVLSGSNDLLTQTTVTPGPAATGVAAYGGWLSAALNGMAAAWSYLSNSTSTTPPSWTLSASPAEAATAGMAFATDASPCNDELLTDWSGSTSGTTATAALANASSYGLPVTGHSKIQETGWGESDSPLSAMSYQTASPPALHTPVRPCGGGKAMTGSTSFVLQYDLSNPTTQYLYFGAPAGSYACSVSTFINTTYAGTDTRNHDMLGCGSVANNFVTTQIVGTGTSAALQVECNGRGGTTNFSSRIPIANNAWYWITMQTDTRSGGSLEVYSTSTWSSMGTVTCTASGWTVAPIDTFQIGQGGATDDFPATVIQYANTRLSPAGMYPILP